MDRWELEFKITELIEEAKEQERFEKFIDEYPVSFCMRNKDKSQFPKKYITSAIYNDKSISKVEEDKNESNAKLA